MKAKIVGNEKSCERKLHYQLVLKGKVNMEIKYFVTRGPFGDMDVIPELQRFEFKDDNRESEYHAIILPKSGDCNKLLAGRTINMRLFMFHNGK